MVTAHPDDLRHWDHQLRRLAGCRALGISNLSTPFFVLYLTRTLHLPISQALPLVALGNLWGGLLEVPTGYFADRFGYRTSMVLGSACCTAGVALCGAAGGLDVRLVGGLMLAQLGWPLSGGPDRALAIDICTYAGRNYRHYEARVVGWNGLSEAMGGLAGASCCAIWGLRSTLWAQAVVYAVMLFLAWRVTEPNQHQNRDRRALKPPRLRRTLRSLGRQPHLVATVVFAGIIGSTTTLIYQLAPLYYSTARFQHQPLPTSWFGYVWASYVSLTWLFRRYCFDWFTRRFSYYGALARLVAVSAGCYLALAMAPALPGLAIIAGLFFVRPIQQPLLAEHLGRLAGQQERATVLSVGRLFQYALPGVFAWITSRVIHDHGLNAGLYAAGIMFGLTGGLSLLLTYRTDQQIAHQTRL